MRNNGNSERSYFLGLQNCCSDCRHEIKRHLLLGRKAVTNLESVLNSSGLWCWRRLLRVPWTARRSNQSILSWSSNTLATWCEELTHLKRPWCWERLRAGEGDDRGWDGWMASSTQWTWVWVDSWSWWWTGRPGMLRFMGSQRVRQDKVTELNWAANEATDKETQRVLCNNDGTL